MITVNNQKIDIKHFPDGTQLLNLDRPFGNTIDFRWIYENDEELVTLIFLVKHFDNVYPENEKTLEMPYVPNARMDRTKSNSEVLTLKYFCEIINSLNFKQVRILDPHSNVTPALLDRVVVESPLNTIIKLIKKLNLSSECYIYYPDEGACKRYSDFFSKKNTLIGHKIRDWETGDIKGLRITSPDGIEFEDGHFEGCDIIMFDDIISYGGTLAYSADKLKKLGFKRIYAYATHTENSVLDPENGKLLKRLENGTVNGVFTTDSIYSGCHEKIVVLDEFTLQNDSLARFL